jgi:hypothetical protein
MVRIAAGDLSRRLMGARLVAEPLVDFRKTADRRQVLRGKSQDRFEFLLRFLEASNVNERAAERDVGGEIGRMADEAGGAGIDRLFETPGPPVFLCECRKRNGRRVRLDPAFEFLKSRRVRHRGSV